MAHQFLPGGPNAIQLRRLVVYHTRDLGLPRPTTEALDLAVMLVNSGASIRQIENEMQYLFPERPKAIANFPVWLLKVAVPKALSSSTSLLPNDVIININNNSSSSEVWNKSNNKSTTSSSSVEITRRKSETSDVGLRISSSLSSSSNISEQQRSTTISSRGGRHPNECNVIITSPPRIVGQHRVRRHESNNANQNPRMSSPSGKDLDLINSNSNINNKSDNSDKSKLHLANDNFNKTLAVKKGSSSFLSDNTQQKFEAKDNASKVVNQITEKIEISRSLTNNLNQNDVPHKVISSVSNSHEAKTPIEPLFSDESSKILSKKSQLSFSDSNASVDNKVVVVLSGLATKQEVKEEKKIAQSQCVAGNINLSNDILLNNSNNSTRKSEKNLVDVNSERSKVVKDQEKSIKSSREGMPTSSAEKRNHSPETKSRSSRLPSSRSSRSEGTILIKTQKSGSSNSLPNMNSCSEHLGLRNSSTPSNVEVVPKATVKKSHRNSDRNIGNEIQQGKSLESGVAVPIYYETELIDGRGRRPFSVRIRTRNENDDEKVVPSKRSRSSSHLRSSVLIPEPIKKPVLMEKSRRCPSPTISKVEPDTSLRKSVKSLSFKAPRRARKRERHHLCISRSPTRDKSLRKRLRPSLPDSFTPSTTFPKEKSHISSSVRLSRSTALRSERRQRSLTRRTDTEISSKRTRSREAKDSRRHHDVTKLSLPDKKSHTENIEQMNKSNVSRESTVSYKKDSIRNYREIGEKGSSAYEERRQQNNFTERKRITIDHDLALRPQTVSHNKVTSSTHKTSTGLNGYPNEGRTIAQDKVENLECKESAHNSSNRNTHKVTLLSDIPLMDPAINSKDVSPVAGGEIISSEKLYHIPEYNRGILKDNEDYNYRTDVSTDYLSRAPAYYDDYCTATMQDRFLGPTGSLILNRADGPRYAKTCAIICSPGESEGPSRCRHWPFCYYGVSGRQMCRFWHPVTVCALYPNCTQDDDGCQMIHPKFFPLLTNPQSNMFKMAIDVDEVLSRLSMSERYKLQSRSSELLDLLNRRIMEEKNETIKDKLIFELQHMERSNQFDFISTNSQKNHQTPTLLSNPIQKPSSDYNNNLKITAPSVLSQNTIGNRQPPINLQIGGKQQNQNITVLNNNNIPIVVNSYDSHQRQVSSNTISNVACKFGMKCTRRGCPYVHPHMSDRFQKLTEETTKVEKIATGSGWNTGNGPDWMEFDDLDVYSETLLS